MFLRAQKNVITLLFYPLPYPEVYVFKISSRLESNILVILRFPFQILKEQWFQMLFLQVLGVFIPVADSGTNVATK